VKGLIPTKYKGMSTGTQEGDCHGPSTEAEKNNFDDEFLAASSRKRS
jgi:hypothetical protein